MQLDAAIRETEKGLKKNFRNLILSIEGKLRMKKEIDLVNRLRLFIRPHPELHPEAGDIFTPKGNTTIKFFFDGGFVVEGKGPELEINFNDDELMILAVGKSVYRFKKSAFIGFELRRDFAKIDSTEIDEMKGLIH